MSEIEFQNFDFNKYKEERLHYCGYTKTINNLEKEKELLKPSFPIVYGVSFVLILFIVVYFVGDLKEDYLASFFLSCYIAYFFSLIFYNDFIVNIISLGKLKNLKSQLEKITKLRSESYLKLQPLENTIRDYLKNQLNDFFEENLYRKRSGSQQFKESLSEFSSMIKELSTINLLTTKLSLGEYRDYLIRRIIDHNFQSSKKTKKLDSIRSIVTDFSKVTAQESKEIVAPERLYRVARKIDNWEEINTKRMMTGLKGEEIIVVVEREFFESIGRKDLAQKVRHVSIEDGDGLGYDVLSFFENGREKYIEVKTTSVSLASPFYLSRNELSFLRQHDEDAFIYRVLISGEVPHIMSYSSMDILEKNELIPVQYMVKAK